MRLFDTSDIDVGVAIFCEAFGVQVAVVTWGLVALADYLLGAMAITTTATRRNAVFICRAFLVALVRVGALIGNAAPGGTLKAEIAGVILPFQSVQADRRLDAGVVAAAVSTPLTLLIKHTIHLVRRLPATAGKEYTSG